MQILTQKKSQKNHKKKKKEKKTNLLTQKRNSLTPRGNNGFRGPI